MAMTQQELGALMDRLQQSQMQTLAALQQDQATAMQRQQEQAVQQATAAQKELMDQMKNFMLEYKQQ